MLMVILPALPMRQQALCQCQNVTLTLRTQNCASLWMFHRRGGWQNCLQQRALGDELGAAERGFENFSDAPTGSHISSAFAF